MPEPKLSAAAVQAIRERAADGFTPSRSNVLALCDDLAAWRALVAELLDALAAASRDGQANAVLGRWQGEAGMGSLLPASARALTALQAVQAALDGAGAGE